MGDFNNNNILGLALVLPDTPDGCKIFKPFEIPTTATTSLYLDDKKPQRDESTIDFIEV